MKKLNGKTILITGASMGIGEAIARAFAAEGANLILVARSEAKLKELCQQLERTSESKQSFQYLLCDLAKKTEVKNLIIELQKFDRIDGLICNAGVGLYGELKDLSEDDSRNLFEINFFSIIALIQALLPQLKKSHQARIVLISSVVGWRAIPRLSVYSASKAALNLLAESLRVELNPHKIKVVNIYPGRTKTAFSDNAVSTGWKPFATQSGQSAEQVAKRSLQAYLKGKRDEYVSCSNRLLIWVNFLFPKLIDWGLGIYFKRIDK